MVQKAALFVASKLQAFKELKEPLAFLEIHSREDKKEKWEQNYCDLCEQLINGAQEWPKHLKTKKHGHNLKMREKLESGLPDKEFY